jgi:uncharacterized protein YkwD
VCFPRVFSAKVRNPVRKSLCCAPGLLLILLLGACGSRLDTSPSAQQFAPSQPIISDAAHIQTRSTPAVHGSSTPQPMIPSLLATPTPAAPSSPRGRGSGTAAAPYGPPPPLSGEETQLTQQLFALINHDRAVRGLYPFRWNNILASGARLHSWNMRHCGFSHTCPDGRDQCTRIAAEGFAGFTDCGECIGLAGPYPTAWGGVRAVQESMINEPPTGWHRIHLTSTTLHSVGVGLVVDARGWLWFTEDMVSQS